MSVSSLLPHLSTDTDHNLSATDQPELSSLLQTAVTNNSRNPARDEQSSSYAIYTEEGHLERLTTPG